LTCGHEQMPSEKPLGYLVRTDVFIALTCGHEQMPSEKPLGHLVRASDKCQ